MLVIVLVIAALAITMGGAKMYDYGRRNDYGWIIAVSWFCMSAVPLLALVAVFVRSE